MEVNNTSKKKMLSKLADNFVQAQEKENPSTYSTSTYSNLTELELKMKESCIAKIIDENGKETYQSDNKSLSKIFEMKMADNPNFNEEYEKYSKADVSLLVLDKDDRKKLAEEINSILENNKDVIESTKMKDKESNEIKDLKKSLIIDKIEEYYDKAKPIELNNELKDKTKEFSKSIDNVFAIAELYHFKDNKGEDVSTVFKGTIVQKDGEKEFSIKFSSLSDEKNIKSDSLLGLKDKVVNLIEEDKSSNKYLMSSFEDFKNKKIKEPDIEIENNFKFDFERTTNLSKSIMPKLYTLKIEDENECKKVEFEDTFYKGFDKLAFTLVDKNTFKAFESINEFGNNIKTTYKDEYLKEENQRIVEKLDEFVKNEKLKETEDGIFGKVAYEKLEKIINYDLEDNFNLAEMKNYLSETFDSAFQVRINNLKDKEEFLIKNAGEFNLTLTENNRILELNSDNEDEYQENLKDFIKGYKESLKGEFFDKLEEKQLEVLSVKQKHIKDYESNEENLKNCFAIGFSEFFNEYDYNKFYDYQERLMGNQIILAIEQEDVDERYYDEASFLLEACNNSEDLSKTISFDYDSFFDFMRENKLKEHNYEKFEFPEDRIEITKKEIQKEEKEEKEVEKTENLDLKF